MPPVTSIPSEDRPKSSAFTVLNSSQEDDENNIDGITVVEAKIQQKINIVKPIQRINDEAQRNHLNSADKEIVVEEMTAPIGPQTILDPKFSRALEFKLRRLKEKEILQENLRRPVRKKRNALTVSNPNISDRDKTPEKKMSLSHPRIDIIVPEDETVTTKISPNMDKSPSPGRKSRNRKEQSENEKPRFITTVKTGQFLLPPPELACLLGLETLYPPEEREKIVYSYASRPKAVATRMKRSANADKENHKPDAQNLSEQKKHTGNLFSGVRALVAGVIGMKHLVENRNNSNGCVITPYSNVMHDKRVVRGSTLAHPNAATKPYFIMLGKPGARAPPPPPPPRTDGGVQYLLNVEVLVARGRARARTRPPTAHSCDSSDSRVTHDTVPAPLAATA
ncbi:hypothetical protein EVAR_8932_1 [Eumeta japonica]|uniref:Uncharacterized protein n=1 Tax=Eumeta variegata TaxID=151549 RepID=A0A4C1U0D4_EUMVA|nr:hypothetical protein EVAR_8932_1 [Eumeta japonica]